MPYTKSSEKLEKNKKTPNFCKKNIMEICFTKKKKNV